MARTTAARRASAVNSGLRDRAGATRTALLWGRRPGRHRSISNCPLPVRPGLPTRPSPHSGPVRPGQRWTGPRTGRLHLEFHEPPDGAGETLRSRHRAGGRGRHQPGGDREQQRPFSRGRVRRPRRTPPVLGPDRQRDAGAGRCCTDSWGHQPGHRGGRERRRGHWQIAWQARDEHTLWTWSNDIFGAARRRLA